VRTALTIFTLMASAGVGHALPPAESGRGFVDGANHHLGDASLVARYGRQPTALDPEQVRMHTHLVHVRTLLGDAPATRPELEPQRARLLGYLDEYIAAGVTPNNFEVPWRSPVFVDGLGHFCAVGYLIEPSSGHALVDRIATPHLTDFMEDIADAMPAVAAWVADSGLSLDELASIQPGYSAPPIEQWEQWDLGQRHPIDGSWLVTADGVTTRGAWLGGQMHGLWTREDTDGHIVGRGELNRGRGTWTSFDASGRTLATGPFKRSYPAGAWRLFHTSGQLAARGSVARGQRIGAWTFYYDREGAVPIARGSFARGGRVTGKWRHYDERGRVFATTTRGPDADAWVAAACPWGASLEAAARRGDLFALRGRLQKSRRRQGLEETCTSLPRTPVAEPEAARLDRLMATLEGVRVPVPDFATDYLNKVADDSSEEPNKDLARVLAANMTCYVEWPHVDGAFANVFATLPGHYPPGVPWSIPEAREIVPEGTEPKSVLVASLSAASGGGRPIVPFR